MIIQKIFSLSLLIVALFATPARADLPQALQIFKDLQRHELQSGVLPENLSKIYLHPQKTARAALLITGLYDTPRFMNGLAQGLFNQGLNVVVLRLSGHGTGLVQDLLNVQYSYWLNDLETGLRIVRLLGNKTTLLGHSTGGTLSALAACRFPTEVDSVVLMAPALELRTSTKVAIRVSAEVGLNSDRVCPNPNEGGAGCYVMDFLNPVFKSQLQEKLPVVPAAGLQVISLGEYTQRYCGANFERLTRPVLMISTESDDVVDHDYNVETATNNNWQKLIFLKSDDVIHPSVPKSAGDEFAKNPRSHNPYFDSMRGRIIDFIFSADVPQSVQPMR